MRKVEHIDTITSPNIQALLQRIAYALEHQCRNAVKIRRDEACTHCGCTLIRPADSYCPACGKVLS